MLHLVFLRHAESAFNADPLDRQLDCPLTLLGEGQARAIDLNEAGAAPFDHVIVSPLLRARQTFDLLSPTNQAAVQTSRLHVWACVREQRQEACDFLAGEDTSRQESQQLLAYRTDVFWHQLQVLVREAPPTTDVRVLIVAHNEWIAAATGATLENARTHTMAISRRTLDTFDAPGHWYVLDLDGVLLTNLRPELLSGAKQAVHHLASNGPLFLCSYNHRARDILWKTQLLASFSDVLCGESGPKADQITVLAARYGLPLSCCVFFDDTPAIVDSCNAAGIRSILQDGVSACGLVPFPTKSS
jgi:HAD superfamily hydrolase (TIGR01509 family)